VSDVWSLAGICNPSGCACNFGTLRANEGICYDAGPVPCSIGCHHVKTYPRDEAKPIAKQAFVGMAGHFVRWWFHERNFMSSDFTIFLIDDDSAVLKSLDRLLQAAGYETKAYLSAETFLSEHDPSTPGCAVLDLALPHLNGLHVQQALTRQGNNRPVIFLTGQANVQESVEAMKAVKAVVSAMKTTSVEDAVAMIPDGASLMMGASWLSAVRSVSSMNWLGRENETSR
jgi:ActR/RegA family two-component response regulator